MKKLILPAILLAAISHQAIAQTNRAFAITAQTKGSYNWNSVREIDLASGEVVREVFIAPANANNYQTRAIKTSGGFVISNYDMAQPTAGMVAATAYDAKNDRLYFTPMFGGTDLRYFDLKSGKTISVSDQQLRNFQLVGGEGEVITRMSFASDGFGYALTNDGNHLIRFSSDAKPVVTDLGNLIDSKKNNGISVHNQCSSWGGDMVGDAYGNLYLFTMRNHVFKINIQSRIAEHIGTIKNLPTDFPLNGAAVDAEGNVVVSSASNITNYYSVNLSTLEAKPIDKKGNDVFNASDLANANLAYQSKDIKPVLAEVRGNDAISIFPNPAINKFFQVRFDRVEAGTYNIELADVSGRRLLNRQVNVTGVQSQVIELPKGAGAGMYMIKVSSKAGKQVYSDKVVVQ